MSEEYDLKKSENGIGQLYPILVAKDGEVIDGFHREQADPKWKRIRLENIDTEEKKLLARLVANFHRRQITREEKAEWINGLAEIYQKQGLKISAGEVHKNEIKEKIIEVTGLSRQTVENYLAIGFKQETRRPQESQVPRVPASQRIETSLGTEVVERHREEVITEEKPKIIKEVKKELLKNPEFLGEATKKFVEKQKLKSVEEARKTLEELGIPPVGKQIEEFYEKLPPPKPQIEKPIQQSDLVKHILGMVQEQNLKCPKCGETKIMWKCGHEFK